MLPNIRTSTASSAASWFVKLDASGRRANAAAKSGGTALLPSLKIRGRDFGYAFTEQAGAMLGQICRDFLRTLFAPFNFPAFSHHVFRYFPFLTTLANKLGVMASPHDSKAPSEVGVPQRQMVHLKTKEECRLGNVTVEVYTVELPSKHAEGVLK